MARRTKGEGTLGKRKDGRWEGWLNKAKEEAIKRIASERNNGQRIAKNAQKKLEE